MTVHHRLLLARFFQRRSGAGRALAVAIGAKDERHRLRQRLRDERVIALRLSLAVAVREVRAAVSDGDAEQRPPHSVAPISARLVAARAVLVACSFRRVEARLDPRFGAALDGRRNPVSDRRLAPPFVDLCLTLLLSRGVLEIGCRLALLALRFMLPPGSFLMGCAHGYIRLRLELATLLSVRGELEPNRMGVCSCVSARDVADRVFAAVFDSRDSIGEESLAPGLASALAVDPAPESVGL